ncbi:copper resistance protein B [Parvibaculum indicum]|jgi:copper resistance protein B|uniref:copper resistance protein B n=1 Tax=Parvibaculum indicum TaxID=562969 RepID=UPI00142102DB|nr:copper resistance protein B [Parvibaculum indicum]NIJ40708.1 copper resistance protein B [Parvibaculum indicum]
MKYLSLVLAAGFLMAALPAQAEMSDDDVFAALFVNRLEYRVQPGGDMAVAEGQLRIGNDEHKLVGKADIDYLISSGRYEKAEFQLRYQRMVSDFFDLHIGVRQDLKPSPNRTYAVIGASGLAPQWFEIDASAFVSEKGDLSLRLDADYDILITQRLVLQPALTLDAALSDDRDTDIAAGLTSLETGLRLRYEIEREFAPYIGVNWERKLGATSSLVRTSGEDPDILSFVAGVRLMF